MIIFYFHGFGARMDESMNKVLSKFGDEIYPMNSSYSTQKNLIDSYGETVRSTKRGRNDILLVGSSLGAYMAFHIANHTQTPALLFNPTFNFRNGAEYVHYSPEYKEQQILFSEKDEFIDIKESLKYLNSVNMDEQVSILEGLTHIIPIDVFDKCFSSFREKYKSLEKKKVDRKSDWDFGDELEKKTTYSSARRKPRQVAENPPNLDDMWIEAARVQLPQDNGTISI